MRDYGTTNNTPAHQAPPVWRAPEGLEDLTAAQVGDGGACQHTNDKPERSGAPRGLRGLAGHHTDTPTDWRPPRGLRGLAAVLVGGGRAWPGFEIDHSERSSRVAISRAGRRPPAHTAARPNKTSHAAAGLGRALSRRAEHHQPRMPNWCGGHRGPGRGAGERRQGLAAVPVGGGRAWPRCRWAVAGPGRASRSTTPSEARVWRSRGRGAAHRHQHAGRHAGTNTQPQTHRHNEAARPHRGRAAHASGRYAAISEVFSASGCRWRPGARRPRRRGRPCRPRPTCPTYAGRTASSRRPRRRS